MDTIRAIGDDTAMVRIILLMGLGLALSGCDRSGSQIGNVIEIATPPPALAADNSALPEPSPPVASLPNYAEREGDTYFYVAEVSEEEREKGRATGEVVGYRYLGLRDGHHILTNVAENGEQRWEYACSDPCRIITGHYRGDVSQIAFSPTSIIGSAFDDAMNGRLEIARRSSMERAAATPNSLQGPAIPSVFIGEWNENPADCGTDRNDSRLRIEASRLRFYESIAEVSEVSVRGTGAIAVQASFSGEGENWRDSVQLALSPSGQELTMGGVTRFRCPS